MACLKILHRSSGGNNPTKGTREWEITCHGPTTSGCQESEAVLDRGSRQTAGPYLCFCSSSSRRWSSSTLSTSSLMAACISRLPGAYRPSRAFLQRVKVIMSRLHTEQGHRVKVAHLSPPICLISFLMYPCKNVKDNYTIQIENPQSIISVVQECKLCRIYLLLKISFSLC